MALRDHLRHGDHLTRLANEKLSDRDTATIASIALAVPTPAAGGFLVRVLSEKPPEGIDMAAGLQHAARYAEVGSVAALGGSLGNGLAAIYYSNSRY